MLLIKKNPSFFNSKNPKVKYPTSNQFIGNISKGGTCNVPSVSLDIHCTGTHTECKIILQTPMSL